MIIFSKYTGWHLIVIRTSTFLHGWTNTTCNELWLRYRHRQNARLQNLSLYCNTGPIFRNKGLIPASDSWHWALGIWIEREGVRVIIIAEYCILDPTFSAHTHLLSSFFLFTWLKCYLTERLFLQAL